MYHLTRTSITYCITQVFAFDRTVSRLLEMQAHEYVKASLGAFPQGAELIAASLSQAQQLYSPHCAPLLDRLYLHRQQLQLVHQQGQQEVEYSLSVSERREMHSAVRRIWKQYRIGTIDETDHAATAAAVVSTAYSTGTSTAGAGFAAEPHAAADPCAGQAMRWEDCLVCLADLAEYTAHHAAIDRLVSAHTLGLKLAQEAQEAAAAAGEAAEVAGDVKTSEREAAKAAAEGAAAADVESQARRMRAQTLLSQSVARLAAKCQVGGAHSGYVFYEDFIAAVSSQLLLSNDQP